MSSSLYDVSVGSYLQILQGASGTLEKAAGHFQDAGTDLNALLDLKELSLHQVQSPHL